MTAETIKVTPDVPAIVRWVEGTGMLQSDPATARRVMIAATGSESAPDVASAVRWALGDGAELLAFRVVDSGDRDRHGHGVALAYRPERRAAVSCSTHAVILPRAEEWFTPRLVSGLYDQTLIDAFEDWCERAGVTL